MDNNKLGVHLMPSVMPGPKQDRQKTTLLQHELKKATRSLKAEIEDLTLQIKQKQEELLQAKQREKECFE